MANRVAARTVFWQFFGSFTSIFSQFSVSWQFFGSFSARIIRTSRLHIGLPGDTVWLLPFKTQRLHSFDSSLQRFDGVRQLSSGRWFLKINTFLLIMGVRDDELGCGGG